MVKARILAIGADFVPVGGVKSFIFAPKRVQWIWRLRFFASSCATSAHGAGYQFG